MRQLPPPPKATPPPEIFCSNSNNNNNSHFNSSNNDNDIVSNCNKQPIIQSNKSESETEEKNLAETRQIFPEGHFETMTTNDKVKNVNNDDGGNKGFVGKSDVSENDKKSRSLFERQLGDIRDATSGAKKRPNVDKTSSTSTPNKIKGNKFLKLFTRCDRKASNGLDKTDDMSDKIRSAPSSPSTLRRFFRRSSFQKPASKMSKSRSETSLNAGREKSPKSSDRSCPKKVQLKRSKSLNDGQRSSVPRVVEKSTNPFEDDDDDGDDDDDVVVVNGNVSHEPKFEESESEPLYQTICFENVASASENKCFTKTYDKVPKVCEQDENPELRCFDCHLIQNGGNRVVSVYENLDDDIPEPAPKPIPIPTRDVQVRQVTISELIAECEDYVKTEQFTRDLSSHLLDMFMQERSKNSQKYDCDLPVTQSEFTSTQFDSPVTKCDEAVSKYFVDTPVTKSDAVGATQQQQSDQTVIEISKSLNPFETDFIDFSPTPTQSDQFSVQSIFSADPSISETPKFPFVHVDSRDSLYENGNEGQATTAVSPPFC